MATAAGALIALGVLAMAVGLIRAEAAGDVRTLTAIGAASTTRRTLTATTAGALALLGALLGSGAAYLALAAGHRSDLGVLSRVPVLDLAITVVGVPVAAALPAGFSPGASRLDGGVSPRRAGGLSFLGRFGSVGVDGCARSSPVRVSAGSPRRSRCTRPGWTRW